MALRSSSVELTAQSPRSPRSRGSDERFRWRKTSSSEEVISFMERGHALSGVTRRLAAGDQVHDRETAYFAHELKNVHVKSTEEVLVECNNTSVSQGLSHSEFERLLRISGPNSLPPSSERPLAFKFVLSFFSGFSPLLWFACLFVFLAWKPFGTPPSSEYSLALACVFLIVIFVTGLFNFYQEVSATRVLRGFKDLLPEEAVVIRDGQPNVTNASLLVVGDVCILTTGCRIPSDVRIVSQSDLRVDASLLTGENLPVKLIATPVSMTIPLLHAHNVAFMGTTVVEGEGASVLVPCPWSPREVANDARCTGVGIVFATGKDNQLSRIAASVSRSAPMTGLQLDLNRFILFIACIATILAVTVILVWIFYLKVYHPGFMNLGSMISNAISVFVAFIPEGLPMALQTGLYIISSRLCKKNNVLAKQLSIIETFGSMTLLASDKTGTLTMNKMVVQYLLTAASSYAVDEFIVEQAMVQHVALAALFCNQARLDGKSGAVVGGNGIDRALLQWINSAPSVITNLSQAYSAQVHLPFSSVTKTAAVVVTNSSSRSHLVVMKGAPEYVFKACTHYLHSDGSCLVLEESVLASIRDKISAVCARGLRAVAIAQLTLNELAHPANFQFETDPPNFPLKGLMLVACVVVADPPRKEVYPAILNLRRAGIKLAMVTGDAPCTAVAIAQQVGLLTEFAVPYSSRPVEVVEVSTSASSSVEESKADNEGKAIVVEGTDIDGMNGDDWSYVCRHEQIIFARVTPDQKLQIVTQLQARKERVAVTGDGVNDAPALRRADIGVAMKSGSAVAREAADVVLLTDNFASIVHGVREGRLIFSNLRKVIGYQCSAGCWAELMPVLATFFLGMPQPLLPFLMIVISCMTDVYAGIAIMTEVPEPELMYKPPRNASLEPLVDAKLLVYSYLWYGNLHCIAGFVNYFSFMASRGFPSQQLIGAWDWGLAANSVGQDQLLAAVQGSSVFFVTLICCQWGHLITIRCNRPYFFEAILGQGHYGGNLCSRLYAEMCVSRPRLPIVAAIILSALTSVFFTEVPLLQVKCGTASVSAEYWFRSIGFSVLFFVLNEGRKWAAYFAGHYKCLSAVTPSQKRIG